MLRRDLRPRRKPVLWIAVCVLLASAGARAGSGQEPVAAGATTLFLIGDAGSPRPGGEPVLVALAREAGRDPARSVVVFLGDNVYPRGLPAPSAKGRAEAERRLRAQLAAVRASGARGVFVPGNHDWGAGGRQGWEAVRRQGRFVEEEGGPDVTFLPREGCPGPEVVDYGRLRLVVLDTQWWLHGGPKLQAPASGCAVDTEEGIVASLAGAIDKAGGRTVVVAGHHPLASGGPHGGHFSWTDHVFPLRAWRSWLWLPLPVVGSAYPLARRAGITAQDLASSPYERFRAALERTFSNHPPLVYASGHEHNLQVLEGEGARRLLVSGAGILGRADRAVRTRATRFAAGEAGFMRMDLEEGGEARLTVLVVDATGAAVERFSEWLE